MHALLAHAPSGYCCTVVRERVQHVPGANREHVYVAGRFENRSERSPVGRAGRYFRLEEKLLGRACIAIIPLSPQVSCVGHPWQLEPDHASEHHAYACPS